MRVFAEARGGRRVALFGSGLIGSAVARSLRPRAAWQVTEIGYDWGDPAGRRRVRERLRAEGGWERFDVVWAAGVSGFGSTAAQMAQETALVGEVCGLAAALAGRRGAVTLHLLSSAGGLFEGQTRVGRETGPAPLRPYGFGKLEQERLALAVAPGVGVRIHRPSSVYGFSVGGRRGLFATLVANALAYRTTFISGTERTIRDYVFAPDIGRFVAGQVMEGGGGAATHLLASGKPTSMAEAVATVERLLGRSLYRRYEARASNALDLSFCARGLPLGWMSTPMEAGLAWMRGQVQGATRHAA